MNENQMQSFAAAVEQGSMSKAARDQFLTVPSLVHRINTLEAELGYRVLDRGQQGVTPPHRRASASTALSSRRCPSSPLQRLNRTPQTKGPTLSQLAYGGAFLPISSMRSRRSTCASEASISITSL